MQNNLKVYSILFLHFPLEKKTFEIIQIKEQRVGLIRSIIINNNNNLQRFFSTTLTEILV